MCGKKEMRRIHVDIKARTSKLGLSSYLLLPLVLLHLLLLGLVLLLLLLMLLVLLFGENFCFVLIFGAIVHRNCTRPIYKLIIPSVFDPICCPPRLQSKILVSGMEWHSRQRHRTLVVDLQ